jgi:hypothetical protein
MSSPVWYRPVVGQKSGRGSTTKQIGRQLRTWVELISFEQKINWFKFKSSTFATAFQMIVFNGWDIDFPYPN